MVGGGRGFFARVSGSSVFTLGDAVVSGGIRAASGDIAPSGLSGLVFGVSEASALEFGTVCVFGLMVALLDVFCSSEVDSLVFGVDCALGGAGFAFGEVCALGLWACGAFWAKLADPTRISTPSTKTVSAFLHG
jgi:hypothetical protein